MEKQDFIDRELAQVKRKYEDIEGVQLISCVRVLVQLKYVWVYSLFCFLINNIYFLAKVIQQYNEQYKFN